MTERTAAWAAAATGGRVVMGDPGRRFSGAEIDSRRLRPGQLFVALKGERTDGHAFLGDAIAAGAGALLVRRGPEGDEPRGTAAWIQVDDPYAALHALARALRLENPRRLLAITGSAGKTTTKELTAAVLARRFKVARSEGNFNNLFGFPTALANVPDGTDWMVAELGMSTPGELRQLSRLARPNVAVFTNVRPVHLMNFPDLRGIAAAKGELLAGLDEDGLVVANGDDAEVGWIVDGHRRTRPQGPVVTFGRSAGVDVRVVDETPLPDGTPGTRFTVVAGAHRQTVELPLHGVFQVDNAAAAIAAGWALGIPLAEAAAALADAKPAKRRGELHPLAGGGLLVDDCYNSNPDAAELALLSASRLPGRRHVAVLGDMLELGDTAPALHRRVGARAAALGFSPLAGVGPLSRDLVAAALDGGVEAHWLPDAAAAAEWATATVGEGDLVLVKGSRGVGLEKVVTALLAGRLAAVAVGGGG